MIHIAPSQPAAKPDPPSTLDLYVCPFTVAVDTREQYPWTFQGQVIGGKQWLIKREVCTLATGDYSIVNYRDMVAIERKSPEDFLGSITAGNARFRREHERMDAIVEAGGFACVIIEGCMAAICDELDSPASDRRVTSETVLGLVASWPQRYRVPYFFAGDRRRAELLAFRILWKWHASHME